MNKSIQKKRFWLFFFLKLIVSLHFPNGDSREHMDPERDRTSKVFPNVDQRGASINLPCVITQYSLSVLSAAQFKYLLFGETVPEFSSFNWVVSFSAPYQ